MALAFDAVGPSASGFPPTSTKPVTWNHTCTGSEGLLLIGVAFDLVTSYASLGTMTVTYASATMAPVGNWPSGGAGQEAGVIAVWKKITPATGTNQVSVSWASGTPASVCGGSLSFTGADQSAGIGAVTYNDSAATNVTAWTTGSISTTAGNILAGFMTCGSGSSFTLGTSRFNDGPGGGGAAGWAAAGTIAGGGPVSIGGAMTSDYFATIAFEILSSASAGANAVLAHGIGSAQSVMVTPHNALAGPNYPATATDLGGGSGSWGTPQFATGGP
jgi:hypothetical protein